ncbi:MAG: hydroxymethylglutaryl-CoA lyase [Actinomycetota bacterium]|nr:hydroxymethylglutaryl-CoA lyase [Actinomycetota bacterium]
MTPGSSAPDSGDAVRIREVGPRDGFQNEPEVIATANKVRVIQELAGVGLTRIEMASFVRADVIPQLADGAEVLREVTLGPEVERMVLVPNRRGWQNASSVRGRFDAVTLFVSASETHNMKNINRSIAGTMADVQDLASEVLASGVKLCGAIATSFGCPYEGAVAVEQAVGLARRFVDVGATEVIFGDTTGMANPRAVERFFAVAVQELRGIELTAHFHNTRGQGLANVVAAYEAGCRSFESSFGELGGCPVPPGSTGNVATEDLVGMLEEMGVPTGVDQAALIDVARWAEGVLGRRLTSRTIVAGPVDWHRAGG